MSAPTGESGTVRRPSRISARPTAPRAQRTAIALASVGTTRDGGLERVGVGGREPPGAEQPAGGGDLADPLEHLLRRQLAVAAGPEDRGDRGRGHVGARGQHDGVAERAGEARLVAVAEHVAADVDQRHELAAERLGGGVERLRHEPRAGVRVHEQHGLAGHARHVRLGEQEAARPARGGRGERGRGVQRLGAGQLVEAPRPGQRIDRAPLPRDAAEAGPQAGGLGGAGGAERSDDVAAAADADAQDGPGAGEERVIRRRRGRRRPGRSRRSPPRRARTPRRRARACPRTGGPG